MKSNPSLHRILGLLAISSSLTNAAVVFSELDLVNNTITLTNTDNSVVDLGGWRFCSHDTDSSRVYSSSSHFNGTSIAANGSLVIDTTSIPFAGLLGGNTMSVGLYVNSSFGSSDALEAFIQFGPEGTSGGGSPETRTQTAVNAGLWDATGSFVQVGATDTSILLNDLNSSVGASSFTSVPEPSSILLGALGLSFGLLRRKRSQ